MCKTILVTLIIFVFTASSYCQDINDTAKVIIKRVVKSNPEMYNISDINLKKDKENKDLYIIRVTVEVPVTTKMQLSVKDTSGDIIMYLINDEVISRGTYRVRWEMPFCRVQENCEGYLPGRYLCEFETDQFIYQKDFYLK